LFLPVAARVPEEISAKDPERFEGGGFVKHVGPQKYSKELIRKAIERLEAGARLTAIARELNVPKNTVKYWLDHSNKYLGEDAGHSAVAVRIQGKLTKETWDIIFLALKELRKKLESASARDLVQVISELFDRQAQFGALTTKKAIPERVIESSEEVRITVQKYLEKRQSAPTPVQEAALVLSEDTLERPLPDGTAPPPSAASSSPPSENGANG
jgi:transposase-like protein